MSDQQLGGQDAGRADGDEGAGLDDPSAAAPSDDPVTLQSLPAADPQASQTDDVPLDPGPIRANPADDTSPPPLVDSLPTSGLPEMAPTDGDVSDPDEVSDGGYLDDSGPVGEPSAGGGGDRSIAASRNVSGREQ
jgi:hypothetical protein